MIETTPEPNLSKKILKLFLVLLLGFILVVIYLNYQRDHRIEQLLQQFKQSGYSTSLKEINEKYVLPLATENGAVVIENAITKLKDPEQKLDEKEKKQKDYIIYPQSHALIQPLAPGESISEEVKTAIEKHLAQNTEALTLLNQGIGMKQFRYCPDYTLGMTAKVPPLLGIRKINNLLQLKTLLHLEKGESEEAIQPILDGLTLTRSFSNDPMLIMYMIQTSLIQNNLESLEHLFSRTAVSEKNLLTVSSLLQELEDAQGLERCFVTEVCMGLDVFNQDRYEKPKTDYVPGLAKNDKIYYLERMKTVIDTNSAPLQERMKELQKLQKLEEEIQNSSRFLHTISQTLLPAFYRICVTGLQRIARLRNAQIALAVERYRLANQKLPEQLSELVPTYLKSELLVDLFDNKPIRYKKLEKGYLIYSVGEDRTDQDGKKADKDQKEGDLVFTVNR